jgi:hypothetical protein
MSKAVGAIFILAGMGVASSLLAIGPEAEQDPRKPAASRNPSVAAPVPAREPSENAGPQPGAAPQQAPVRSVPPSAANSPPPKFSAPVVVMLPYRAEPLPAGPKHRVGSLPRDRASLTRELQVELRRVGCYGGELNGVWTPAARKAMKAFTDRVNASLPVGEPDDILLALVQTHQGEACGVPCPAGQGLAEDGRCLPGAILAQAARKPSAPTLTAAARPRGGPQADKPAPAIAAWSTTSAALPPPPSPPPAIAGRMALAGPMSDAAPPAIGEAPPGPVAPAVHGPKPQAGAAERARRARAHERAQRFEPRAYGRRGFVESVLFSRNSMF